MVRRDRCYRPIIAICAAVVASCAPQLAASQQIADGSHTPRNNQLEIAVAHSDEYAESIITMKPPKSLMGIGPVDHEKITGILTRTKDLIDNAYGLIQNERTLKEGQDMMSRANQMFGEVKDIIRSRVVPSAAAVAGGGDDDDEHRDLLRKKYAGHDLDKVEEDERRALDIARKIYETMVTFPECVEQLLEVCLGIINDEIGNLGLSTIEVVVHEKRNQSQEGYNKVVIITNELADRVRGRTGDGIVYYPFLWNDAATGQRTLGVDGKWNCHDFTPEDCCNTIKLSVPGADTKGNNIECHIFVPYGGVGNPRRNDRVFITLSPDGRVHEPPIIQ